MSSTPPAAASTTRRRPSTIRHTTPVAPWFASLPRDSTHMTPSPSSAMAETSLSQRGSSDPTEMKVDPSHRLRPALRVPTQSVPARSR